MSIAEDLARKWACVTPDGRMYRLEPRELSRDERAMYDAIVPAVDEALEIAAQEAAPIDLHSHQFEHQRRLCVQCDIASRIRALKAQKAPLSRGVER